MRRLLAPDSRTSSEAAVNRSEDTLMNETGDLFRTRVLKWTANHFSMANDTNDAVALLRAVADRLEELPDAVVHDISFCVDVEGNHPTCRATVYLDLQEASP